MASTLKAIFFDLGNTLIYSINPWEKILLDGVTEFHRILFQSKTNLPEFISSGDLHKCLIEYYDQRTLDLKEIGTFSVLRGYLIDKGYIFLSDTIIRYALDSMYGITQLNWTIEMETVSTLSKLQSHGYKLGLLSNAADDHDVQQLIDKWHLRKYFDFILTSAACGYRKPHPEMFLQAMSHFSISPQQSVMVGDTLSADIKGANDLGIFSIWINRRSKTKKITGKNKPNATISNLDSLVPLIEKVH